MGKVFADLLEHLDHKDEIDLECSILSVCLCIWIS